MQSHCSPIEVARMEYTLLRWLTMTYAYSVAGSAAGGAHGWGNPMATRRGTAQVKLMAKGVSLGVILLEGPMLGEVWDHKRVCEAGHSEVPGDA